jgi:riboflavin kinase / FMN adenylyltransferase
VQIVHGVRNLDSALSAPLKSSVLTIGNFDGVHLGHQALVKRVVGHARQQKAVSAVMTFEPHPVKVLYPDRHLKRIFDISDQFEQLKSLGVELLVIEPFSREFSQLEPERYLTEWIYRPFMPSTLVVGYDFSFGANRRGSIDFLKEHAPGLGFAVEVMAPIKVGDVLVSSSRIRQAVESGDVALAHSLLGRHFYLEGIVERGAGRGRTLGIPTANLSTSAELIPAGGVYAAWVVAESKRWKAAVNVGTNPTFNSHQRVEGRVQEAGIEAHLLGFSGDLYGDRLKIEFVSRLREEKKFSSAEELVDQIRSDIFEADKKLN